ncbi:hypothetical protein FIM04_00770 [SAR202 cluster bacterium AC-409-J13_OGT_754m]|nr:hypothetical protein [SAR202 cluster bacterium AC-409-J13_OGT_754m]
MSERIGEIIEANTNGFTVHCYKLYESPPLGSIIQSGIPTIFGVISEITTEPLDPSRPIIAIGQNEPTEDEIYRSNPQLNNLLCTRLTALTIGYSNNENFSHGLPPHPPRIHSFVYLSDNHYIESLAKSFDFLHLLLSSGTNDEVVSACLRQISQKLPDGYPFLIESGQALATELIGQFPRLNAILRRLS